MTYPDRSDMLAGKAPNEEIWLELSLFHFELLIDHRQTKNLPIFCYRIANSNHNIPRARTGHHSVGSSFDTGRAVGNLLLQ